MRLEPVMVGVCFTLLLLSVLCMFATISTENAELKTLLIFGWIGSASLAVVVATGGMLGLYERPLDK